MMRKLLLVCAWILSVGGGVAVSGEVAMAQPNSTLRTLAEQHYELGRQYYRAADYQKALEEFQQAYKLQPLPGLLYNIGRSYEALNDLEKAVEHYSLYLEKKPDAQDREILELRIQNIRKRLEQQRQDRERREKERLERERQAQAHGPQDDAAKPTGTDTDTDGQTAADAQPADTQPLDAQASPTKPWRKPVGWALLGVGGASLVTGIVFGALVVSKNNEYDTAVEENRTFDELQDLRDTADQYQTIEIATLVAGGVLAAAGGSLLVWHWLDNRPESPATTATVVPYTDAQSTGLMISGRF